MTPRIRVAFLVVLRFFPNPLQFLRCFLGVLSFIAFQGAIVLGQPVGNLPTVDSIQAFERLSSEQVRLGYPVRIEGVVVYSDPEWQHFWLSDETGRLSLPLTPEDDPPPARTRSVVTGRTALVDGTPRISEIQVRALRAASLPAPVILMPLVTPQSQQVQLSGTVVDVFMERDRLRLVVAFLRKHQVRVTVKESQPEDLAGLLGAHVEITGCPAEIPDRRPTNITPIEVFVPDMSDIAIYSRGPLSPFLAPMLPIEDLVGEYERIRDQRLIRIQGTTKANPESRRVVVADGENEVNVILRKDWAFKEGVLIDAVGIVWKTDDGEILLDRSVIREAVEDEPTRGPTEDLPVLHTVHAVRGLTPEQAERKYPVEITGVVTYYDPVWRILFIQDATSGIYINAKDRSYAIQPGDRIQVRGISDPGGFAPMIEASQIIKLSTGQLPAPRQVSFGRLMSGAEDSQWVTISGTVESAEPSQSNLQFRLRNPHGTFEAVLAGGAAHLDAHRWVGSTTRFTGVCGIQSNASRQAIGIYFHVPGIEFVEFEHRAPDDPFALSTTAMTDLLRFKPFEDGTVALTKISGVVTFVGAAGLTALQDDRRGLLIQFEEGEVPSPQSTIEVVGFPRAHGFGPTLQNPRWQTAPIQEPVPAPTILEPDQSLSEAFQGRLVQVEATVVENNLDGTTPMLTLRRRGVVFTADLYAVGDKLAEYDLPPGTTVWLTGVCSIQTDEWNNPWSFRLLVPQTGEIRVLRAAPWLTPRRAGLAVAALCGIALLALGAVAIMRRKIAQQSERIRKEMQGRSEMAERYNELFENAGDLIFTLDRSGICIGANPSAAALFLAGSDRAQGEQFCDRLDPPSRKRLLKVIEQLTDSLPQSSANLSGITKDGDPFHLETAIRLRSRPNEKDEIQCIGRNVTERVNLENRTRQAQKLETVGQLAAGVAHDYNNLMTVVQMNTAILKDIKALDGENAEVLDEIHDAADRASVLTDQLLAFSRKQVMDPSVINVSQLLQSLSQMLQRLIGDTVRLTFEIEDDLPPIRADKGMVEQIVINLVLNARDSMPKDGTIVIRTRQETTSKGARSDDGNKSAQTYVVISVEDEGVGIAPDKLNKIFEPFYTTKEVGKGTGLGLFTAYGIANQHGGWIDAASTPGRGSCFDVFLPVCWEEVRASDAEETRLEAISESPSPQGTILIVEDDHAVRRTVCKALHKAGFVVLEATNGREGLAAWNNHPGSIDLLITDMVMPGDFSGHELALTIRKNHAELRTIYISGYNSQISAADLTDQECLLKKPFKPDALLSKVSELLSLTSH